MRKIVFLDFDDVICTNQVYGAYDLFAPNPPSDLHEHLFSASCVRVLQAIHQEHTPAYVVTTSWLRLTELEPILYLLRKCGLAFVADNTATPGEAVQMSGESRAGAIERWLDEHGQGCPFVVLDDPWSGEGLQESVALRGHLVLCEIGRGLEPSAVEAVRVALRKPPYKASGGLRNA